MASRYDIPDYKYDNRRLPHSEEYDYSGYEYGESSRSALTYGTQDHGSSYPSTRRGVPNDISEYDYSHSAPPYLNAVESDRWRGLPPASSFHMSNSRPPISSYRVPVQLLDETHRNLPANGFGRENGPYWQDRRDNRMFEPSVTWRHAHRERNKFAQPMHDPQRLNGYDVRRQADTWRPSRPPQSYDSYRPDYSSRKGDRTIDDLHPQYSNDSRHINEQSRIQFYQAINRPSNARPSAMGNYKRSPREVRMRQENTEVPKKYSDDADSPFHPNRSHDYTPQNNHSYQDTNGSSSTMLERRDGKSNAGARRHGGHVSSVHSDSDSGSSDSDASSFSIASSVRTAHSTRSQNYAPSKELLKNVSDIPALPSSAMADGLNSRDELHDAHSSHFSRVEAKNEISARDDQRMKTESSATLVEIDRKEDNEALRKEVQFEDNSSIVQGQILLEVTTENSSISRPTLDILPEAETASRTNLLVGDDFETSANFSELDVDTSHPSVSRPQRSSLGQFPSVDSLTSLDTHLQSISRSSEKGKAVDRAASLMASQERLVAPSDGLRKALHMAISARQKYDSQTREQRVNPILISNLSLADKPSTRVSSTPEKLVQEVLDKVTGASSLERHTELRPSLAAKFHERQSALSEKVERLKREYLALNERWQAHCAKLDSAVKAGAMEESVPNLGRTTRRSAANLGDAVRSDLEMERIIASLGNEDLTDPNHLAVRNVATIPDMISVEVGQVESIFDDTNGRVDDPHTFYDCRSGFYDWTPREEQIFLEKYAEFPKQFGIISEFLPHKTTAQCVLYYYLHKKRLIDFRNAANSGSGRRRKGNRKSGKQKSNALLADIQERDKKRPDRGGRRRSAINAAAADGVLTSESTPLEATPEVEARPKRRRIQSSAKVAEREQGDAPRERKKPGRKPKKAKIAVVENGAVPETKFIDVNETLGRRKVSSSSNSWSSVDKDEFIHLLAKHGKNFKRIAASMPNKTTIQVSNFYKTHAVEMNLDEIAANAQSRSPSAEPVVNDPFVHGNVTTHTISATSVDVIPASSGPTDPFSSQAEGMKFEFHSNMLMNPAHDRISHRHTWVPEQLSVSSQLHYRTPNEPPPMQPQHRYMSILHPPSGHTILTPQFGSMPPMAHIPPMTPLHFSAYNPAPLTQMPPMGGGPFNSPLPDPDVDRVTAARRDIRSHSMSESDVKA